METTLRTINQIIACLFFICYAYQFIYIPVALFKKRKPLPPAAPHRYAVLIAARNEQTVIGDLLDSLNRQSYDMSLVKIFVIADNCSDATSYVARQKGAVVYERFDRQYVGKGYALQALLEHIRIPHADILVVGHHGSKNAASPELLEAAAPRAAVISVGANNSYGHPSIQTLDRLREAGCAVYRTDQQGTIIFRR